MVAYAGRQVAPHVDTVQTLELEVTKDRIVKGDKSLSPEDAEHNSYLHRSGALVDSTSTFDAIQHRPPDVSAELRAGNSFNGRISGLLSIQVEPTTGGIVPSAESLCRINISVDFALGDPPVYVPPLSAFLNFLEKLNRFRFIAWLVWAACVTPFGHHTTVPPRQTVD
ncbi:MAG: hypothetical protein ACYC6N_25555 [Pirellulaceae bacterium]